MFVSETRRWSNIGIRLKTAICLKEEVSKIHTARSYEYSQDRRTFDRIVISFIPSSIFLTFEVRKNYRNLFIRFHLYACFL